MEETRWRVPTRVPVAKAIVVAVLLYLAVVTPAGAWGTVLALVGAAGIALAAVRDLAVPVRLAAGPDGVTVVTRIRRRVTLPWARIRRIRVDSRRRSRQLEIDTGEGLYVVGRHEVDADLDDVASRLEGMRAATSG